ncbi:MAG: formylglycine-generating enzyme family protein [Desulfomonilaceae bacterium]
MTTQRPVWIIVYCVLLLVSVTMVGYPSTILAGELPSRKITVSAEFSASGLDQFLAQSLLDSADVPLLPAVPGGGSVPLPPSIRREPSAKTSEPVVNGNNLVDGTGKYSGMLLIPGGTFEMGSPEGKGRPDERPNHQVFVKDFYIAKQDVTAQDYCGFLKSQGENSRDGSARIKLDSPDCPVVKSGNAYKPKDGFADKPVVCVSWYGATEYAEWVGGRLPTAAEREKAALLTTPHPPADRLVFHQRTGILPVSLAAPGVREISGMFGNVWEWCSDWYSRDYYAQSQANNPTGPALGEEKEIRGGSWVSPESSWRIRNRHKASPRGYFRTVGFRVVKD